MRRIPALLFVAFSATAVGCSRPQVARIGARPVTPTIAIEPGAHRLGLGTTRYRGLLRDGTLYIPRAASSGRPLPLAVWLHGGGGRADDFRATLPLADEFGVVMLALDARDNTWDGIDSPFGPDVEFIDASLRHTFQRVPIDPGRIALGGLSDGGFYALSVGIANGDLFTHLIAVAPGYVTPPSPPVGSPRIFLAHGTRDNVYNVAGTKYRILPKLQSQGYDVTYFAFDGPHFITPVAARAALTWLVR